MFLQVSGCMQASHLQGDHWLEHRDTADGDLRCGGDSHRCDNQYSKVVAVPQLYNYPPKSVQVF
jgi:hypothetical protein